MAKGGQCPLSHRLLDFIDHVELEESLKTNRDLIVKNLNVKDLLINPVSFKDIITEDEQGKIISCYDSSRTEKAAKMFIDAILRSKDKTKWSVFKDALKLGKGFKLIKEILCKGQTDSLINHGYEKEQIILQRGSLAPQLDAELVGNEFRQEQLLTTVEYQEAMATHRNYGNTSANRNILIQITRKKNFFPTLLTVLWNQGKRKCVKELDLDFYTKMAGNEITSNSNCEADPCDTDNSNENDTDDIGANHMAVGRGTKEDIFNLRRVQCYENNDKRKTENKMGRRNKLNEHTQDDNGPVASRTRSKTKLLQIRDSDETLCEQPNLDYRSSGTSSKPMKTLQAEQVVKQYPLSGSRAANKPFLQLNNATTNARLQEGNTQKNLLPIRDFDETILKQPVVDHKKYGTSHKPREILPSEQNAIQYPSRRDEATTRKPKSCTNDNKTPVIRNLRRCTCGRLFISQEALERHRSFDCKDS